MKLSKKILLSLVAVGLTSAVFADDFDDYGYDEETAEPTVTIGGKVEVAGRAYVEHKAEDRDIDWNDLGGRKIAVFPSGKLNAAFSNSFSDMELKLKFDKTSIYDGYYWDILDEFTARAYVGDFQFEAGKMRVVWGKGDKLHVLDNFNANDYTDYIIPDYIDRRISEPMFRLVYSTPSNLKIEGIYTPFMTADRLGTGIWTPKASATLKSAISAYATGKVASTRMDRATATNVAYTITALSNDLKTAGAAYQTAALAYSKAVADYQTTAIAAEQGDTEASENLSAKKNAFDINQVAYNATKASYDAANAAFTAAVNANAETLTPYGLDVTDVAGTLSGAVAKYVTAAETAEAYALTNASALSSDPDSIYPDLYQLKYGQFGFRSTFTLGAVDLGVSYYNGHNKQPSVDKRKIYTYLDKVLANESVDDGDRFISYDRLQVFGFEAAGILFGRLNSRMEFAYNMTDDWGGDDPAIHNHSLNWVAGFDIDLPIHNFNFNVQTQGKYILGTSDIEDSIYKRIDIDFDDSGYYTNNKLVVDITDTYNHEKIKLDVKGIWGIERGDVIVMPSLSFTVKDDFELDLSGMFIWCNSEYSEFDGWENNSFAQIGCKYQF